ncbi:MAG TPA: SRPBCC domain-containing protein [Glycomyces sp.]|nr:SRPBCC domain-containing protein [Glycomyces sp.]
MALLIIVPIAVAVAAYCVWALRRDRRTETAARLDAPAHEVWAVLTDFGSYGEWNPLFTAVSGQLAEDERLDVTRAQEGGKPRRLRPAVLRVSPARQIRWLDRLGPGGCFDREHYLVLEPQEDGTTLLTHGERVTGVLLPVLSGRLDGAAADLEAMNAALAERVGAARR